MPRSVDGVIFCLLALTVTWSFGFYLPGLAPVNYCPKDSATDTCKADIKMFVNRLDSDQTVIPYEYHHFDFCTGDEDESPVENLGQVLLGERIRPSTYAIWFLQDEKCKALCEKTYKTGNKGDPVKLKRLQKGMMLNYQHHWIMDNMPVMFCFINTMNMNVCTVGFPMGCYVTADGTPKDACVLDPRYNQANTYYLFNHVDLEISYRDMSADATCNPLEEKCDGRIISIGVVPRSIRHPSMDGVNCGPQAEPMAITPTQKDFSIVYSYSVTFKVRRECTTSCATVTTFLVVENAA